MRRGFSVLTFDLVLDACAQSVLKRKDSHDNFALLLSHIGIIYLKKPSSNFDYFRFGLRFRLVHFLSSLATYGRNWNC
eukprot:UN24402